MKTKLILTVISLATLLVFSTSATAQTNDPFIVVLDAGHGGKDPGNLGNGYREKDIALKVVLEVGKQLEQIPNVKVVYTRKKDVFIDLFVRGKIANKAKADLFVSVHCDSHTSQAYGAGTFVLGLHRNKTNFELAKKENSVIFLEDDYKTNYEGFDPNAPEDAISIILGLEEYLDQSIYLASLIQNNFIKIKRKDRNVKQAGFIVLHQTVMPSVLVELGFLTNNKEGKYLNSKKGQQDMANSITAAIVKYKASVTVNSVEDARAVETPTTTMPEAVYEGVEFKVQIAASSRKLMPKPYNFKGLETITRHSEGNLYKYFYGSTSNYNTAKLLEEDAKAKGYSSCFIVAFKNGKKQALDEVLKSDSN